MLSDEQYRRFAELIPFRVVTCFVVASPAQRGVQSGAQKQIPLSDLFICQTKTGEVFPAWHCKPNR
jgi:hypothetical protein